VGGFAGGYSWPGRLLDLIRTLTKDDLAMLFAWPFPVPDAMGDWLRPVASLI